MTQWGIRKSAAALVAVVMFALVVLLPATALAAAGSFVGGADQVPAYVLNDHTPVAVHFSAGAGSGLATGTTFYVKVRYTIGTGPAGLTNRGYTWNPTTRNWAQERDLWTAFPTASTNAAGAISGWVFVKFGDDTKSGPYHLMISLSSTGQSSTFNSSIVPTMTALDSRVSGSWVHNGVATGADASASVAVTDATSSTVLSLQKTEANGVDDDSNGIVDDEDWGPVGATGDFRMGVPSLSALGVTVNGVPWPPGIGFISGPPDTDLAIGAPDTSAPSAPPSLTVDSHDASAALAWGAATDDHAVAGFYVYRWSTVDLGVSYSAVHSRIATLGPDTMSYIDHGLTNGNTYFYEVRAFDADTNVGPRSTTGTATPVSGLPQATVTPPAPDGQNGWYQHAPTVTLTTGGGRTILYSLEASPSDWVTYTVPVVINAGLSTLTYRDIDGGTMSATQTCGPFQVDTSAPTAKVSAPAMSVVSSRNRTFMLSWSGLDTGSGIDSYDVYYKTSASGAWQQLRGGTPATSTPFTADPGANVYFRVRAYDIAGNVGDWSPQALTLVPFDETKLKYSSGWKKGTNSNYYMGSARINTKKGGSAGLPFTKGTLWLVTKTGPKMGKMAVYLGSKKVATVNLYSATTKYRQTLKILSRSTGTKAATVKLVNLGVSGHKKVEIDGFVLQR
jgi:hypothetical protein